MTPLAAFFVLLAASLTPVDEAGYQRLVAANKGKVVLVDFWATWCGPCREEMPQLVKLEAKFRASGLILLTVSADEPEEEAGARKFLLKSGIAGAAWLKQAKSDDAFIRAIDPKWSGALPALFLYDRTGKKVKSWIGETPMAEVESAIKHLL